jgi:TolB-like protein/Tfp pilus assembly protein PilF
MLVSPDGETVGTGRSDKKPVVKIIDFGQAKALKAPTDPMSLTRGGFVGTPAFASPEQFEHSALDVRSDIYSLGVTLWFSLTGKTPFAGHSVEEIHRAKQSNALPIEQLKAAHVPSRLRSLLESMLALEPATRPDTHELTARLRRCSAEASGVPRTRVALAAAVILVLGVSAFFVFRSLRAHPAAAGSALNPVEQKSLAVLPFQNLSADPENALFTDGVQDEILNDLAKIADLKVISRTSAMQYKTGVKRNLREIAKELGVAHVVEGSVQRAANRVRVSAQLIDARNDTHVWGEKYDRDLADVFGIQSEIAQKIADQLQAKLLPKEKEAIAERSTKDLAAYDLFLQAKGLIHDSDVNPLRMREDLFKAVQLLEQALARDPAFFLAHCQLAYAHDLIYIKDFDHTEKRLALAETSVRAAVRLQPDSGETHLAQAIHFYWGYLNYDRARGELAKAQHALPNNVQILKFLGLVDRRQGHWDEAIRNFEEAVDLDPRNAIPINDLGDTYFLVHEYGEASAVYNRSLALEPRSINFRTHLASIAVEAEANTAPLRAVLNAIEAEGPSSAAEVAEDSFFLALRERDPAAAARALANIPSEDNVESFFQLPHAWYEGLLAKLREDAPGAHAAFTAARAEAEKIVRAQSGNVSPLTLLAFIDAELGDKGKAIEEGRAAGICEIAHDLAASIDPAGIGERGAREINRGEGKCGGA